MKIIIVQDYVLENQYRPMCGTCKHRGNVSIAYDFNASGIPAVLDGDKIRVTGVHCDHPDTPGIQVQYDSICDKYYPVNETLKRILLTKRLI